MQQMTPGSPRGQGDQARVRALVRFNSLMFQTLATASFLETAVALQASRLAQRFDAWPDVQLWLEHIWWPRRAECGRALRDYVQAVWPEFDWNTAYEEFLADYRPRPAVACGRGGKALEALTLCAESAQAALLYRTLAQCADEPALRELAGQAASCHAAHFDFFRALHDRGGGAGWLSSLRAVAASCCQARDVTVPAALATVERNWRGPAIVPVLAYPEYRERMAGLVARHARLGFMQRLLFRPWREAIRASQCAPTALAAVRPLRMAQQAA